MPDQRLNESKAWGIEVPELPQDWTPLEVTAVIKCLDEDGVVRLRVATTDALSEWEALGMHQAAAGVLQQELNDHFFPDDDEDDEDLDEEMD